MAGELASGHCHPVHHTRPALPTHLPECELSEDSEEDESDEDNDDEEDNCAPRRCNDSSESSDMNSLDSTSDAEGYRVLYTKQNRYCVVFHHKHLLFSLFRLQI